MLEITAKEAPEQTQDALTGGIKNKYGNSPEQGP
jgi:hypothetical protein